MNNKCLISVIVPVYNVESYLEECIDSIINQTLDTFELILVNDGSTDKSPDICNEYAKKDNRIKVIHKENEGASSARNTGLDIANGKYISFIDSDDIIERTMFEEAINNMNKDNSDIYIFYGRECHSKLDISNKQLYNYYEVITANECLYKLFNENVGEQVWNKVFKRKLWNNIRFPVGKTAEDIDVLYKVIENSKLVTYDSKVLYYIRTRQGSVTRSKKVNFDALDSNKKRYEYIAKKYPKLKNDAYTRYMYAALGVYDNIICYDNENKRKKEILNLIKNGYKIVKKNKKRSKKRKIQYFLVVFFTHLYNITFRYIDKKKYRKMI